MECDDHRGGRRGRRGQLEEERSGTGVGSYDAGDKVCDGGGLEGVSGGGEGAVSLCCLL
jgi:hypothetical protein